MEIIFEVLLQIILEFILGIGAELLAELGLHGVAHVFRGRKTRNPALAFIGYALLGVMVGGVSLLVFPRALVRGASFHGTSFHGIGLLISPLLAGFVMSAIGSLRRRRGMSLIRLDSFAYGFIFAFGMALIRFLFATQSAA
jgi:hypothetical protein